MISAREQQDLTTDSVARREWIRPAVQQLAAGSAEDAIGPSQDAITNPS